MLLLKTMLILNMVFPQGICIDLLEEQINGLSDFKKLDKKNNHETI